MFSAASSDAQMEILVTCNSLNPLRSDFHWEIYKMLTILQQSVFLIVYTSLGSCTKGAVAL